MVDENLQKSKFNTVSVRIEDELLEQLESVSRVTGISKSEFLRACIEKLCNDNQPLVDHCPKLPDYIEYIKTELSKLPSDMVLVKNGTWKDVSDATVVMICDELWKVVDSVYKNWIDFVHEYNLLRNEEPDRKNGLLSIAEIAMIIAEKKVAMQGGDITQIIRESPWIDEIDLDKITLLTSCKKAIEENSALKVMTSYLESESSALKKKVRLSIDAKGTLRRAGSSLYLPIESEPLSKK